MKRCFFILIILFFLKSVFSQVPLPYDDKGVLYKYEKSVGAMIHSDGWGLNIRRGKHITGTTKRMFELEVVSMKHPKEIKSVNPLFNDAKSYFYGKMNTFTIVRYGIGLQHILFDKGEKSGVQVRYSLYGGVAPGITKPVYLFIVYSNPPYKPDLQIEKYDPQVHYLDNIWGRAPFTYGLNQLSLHPGIYGKFGLSFDYARKQEDLSSLETGLIVDAYPYAIPIMAYAKNKSVFISLYLSAHFGMRFNKH